MPLLPSLSAQRTARAMLDAATTEFTPGTVTIDDAVFSCALVLGPVEPKLADDGINYRNGQDVSVRISKAVLPTAPAARSIVTVGGIDFRVIHSGPRNDYDTSWHITARRYP